MMRMLSLAAAVWVCSLPLSADSARGAPAEIVCDGQASSLERLAAQEIRRYIYLRTGALLDIRTPPAADAAAEWIVVGRKDRELVTHAVPDGHVSGLLDRLSAEQHALQTVKQGGRRIHLVVGGDDVGTLYAAYRFAEQLGVRFYLHGDVIPDEPMPLALPDLDQQGKPLFATRGIQPFHDFPEGPDWWNADAYQAVLGQLPKLRMNFFGLHTYPEGDVGPEPTVWIGPPDEIGPDGQVLASYPARHFATSNVTGAWGYQPRRTGDYAFGAGAMFDRDDYGPEYMQDMPSWTTMDPEQSNALFNRFGALLHDVFHFARRLGIKTCVGTETPLVIPRPVRERLEAAGASPTDPATVQRVYEGIFRRIMAAYPIDYYWLWTPEGWTWEPVTLAQIEATRADFQAVERAADAVGAPFQLATCGWVLGPPQQPSLFDGMLPKSWPLSCINRNVGHDPVEPGFVAVSGRPKWAIPWLEDDPALIIPQLWVGRLRKDAADALRYGCDGLLGIHWRTRVLGPNVSALAQAAWSQAPWKSPETDAAPPALAGSFDQRRQDYPAWRMAPVDDFFADWAAAEFGPRAAPRIAPIFARLDCRLPRPSDWVHGPGGVVPDSRPWSEVSSAYAFVDELTELRPSIRGLGHLERFDYWLASFKYLRAVARANCTWAELNAAVEALNSAPDAAARREIAVRQAIPLRTRLVRELGYVQQYLLETVGTPGELGTVANWQQHVFPLMLDPSEKAITEATGEPLTLKATLPREYPGHVRLFVPVVRTLLRAGEPLRLDAVVLGAEAPVVICHWRPLGDQRFRSVPLAPVGRGVRRVVLPARELQQDFEYYVEATTDRKVLRFPPTAPELNQTVVLIAEAE